LVLMLEPVFAGIAAYLDGEHLSALQVVGALVILTGITVAELAPRRAPAPRGAPVPVGAP
jgi:drug/metabolite transporter (DMT)-like permease